MVLSMDRWIGKVAIITGASAGIGAALAEELVEIGLKVAGLARRKDRLDDLAKKLAGKKGTFLPIQADISKEEDILNAFKLVKANLGPIHILVNNAGIIRGGFVSDSSSEEWNNIFQVNVIGLSIATREAIKDMRANNIDGHIIHVNSILGHQVLNFLGMSVYPASKFAVRALTETLRLELNSLKLKIKITSVSPGAVDTEMLSSQQHDIKKFYEQSKVLAAEDIVDAIVYALSTPSHVQIQELTIRPVFDIERSDVGSS